MNPWPIIKGFAQAANAALGIVPPLAWALLCLGMLLHGAMLQHELKSARSALVIAQNNYAQLDKAMKAQKELAQQKYDALKAQADEQQLTINALRKTQEIKDENHKAENDKAGRALAAAMSRNDGRLRDPWATGCRGGGGGAQGGPGVGAGSGGEDGAQTGGLLSAQLSQRLQQRAAEADPINIAYQACRAALYRDRGLPPPADNDPQ